MRIMGVDYGSARTGVAVSDISGVLASGIETIKGKNARKIAESIVSIAHKYDVGIIVVGLPKNMNNTLGERGEATLKLVDLLKSLCDCEIVTWDERLTTVSAIGILNETNTRGSKRRSVIDTVAAEIILQNYLDYNSAKRSPPQK